MEAAWAAFARGAKAGARAGAGAVGLDLGAPAGPASPALAGAPLVASPAPLVLWIGVYLAAVGWARAVRETLPPPLPRPARALDRRVPGRCGLGSCRAGDPPAPRPAP